MSWTDTSARVNTSMLRVFGEPITYEPIGGVGAPIATTCIIGPPTIDESSSAHYFADIHVDPAVIPNPRKKDSVWIGDALYEVAKVKQSERDAMWILALHRKFEP